MSRASNRSSCLRKVYGSERMVPRMVSAVLLVMALTSAAEAAPGDASRASTGASGSATEWCQTDVRWRSKGGVHQLRGGGCPTEGSCDSASVRDAWIPGASMPPVIIRVVFNVFREDDGSNPAATQEDVDAQLAEMNANFEPSRVGFVGSTRFIDSSTYRHFTDDEEEAMKNLFAELPDGQVNVFVTDVAASYVGVGTFPWDPDALTSMGGIIIDDDYFGAGNRIMSHEMGHNLGLWHTHHGVSEVSLCAECYESADGVNGDATGDFCADTAPTPVNGFCGPPGGNDPCSGLDWGPTDPQNYMGYASPSCWTEFSPQQRGRMHCWIDSALTGWLVVEPVETPLETCVDFPPVTSLEAGMTPEAVAVADLDGDGARDLAVVNRDGNDVSVLRNLGNGSFWAGTNYPVGSEPEEIAAGDLNGDGHRDLAVVNYASNDVSILLNNGDGTFTPSDASGVGQGPKYVTMADVDGDGDRDLAVANYLGDSVSILMNFGDGTFADDVTYSVDNPTAIVVVDLDSDGDLDMAVTGFGSEVTVFKGSGTGSFGVDASYLVAGLLVSLAAVDLDADSDLDLVVTDGIGDDIALLLNAGDATFDDEIRYPAGEAPAYIETADLDSDGDLDLLILNHQGESVMVRFSNGDGTLSSPLIVDGIGAGALDLAAEDLDGDGDPDLVVTSTQDVSLIWNEGCTPPLCPSYAEAVEYGLGGVTPTWAAVGDLDGDGDDDLAVTRSSSHDVSVLLNAGGGSFSDPVDYSAGYFPNSVVMGDLDGDGDQDLVLTNPGTISSVSVLFNQGDGTFGDVELYGAGGNPVSAAVVDVDDDNDLDLALALDEDAVSILENAGDGTFSAPATYAIEGGPSSIAAGDLDGDGAIDLAVAARSSNDLAILLNLGDGTFTGLERFAAGDSPRSVAMGDFDGDGDRDLAVACFFGAADLVVLSNLGNGSFSPAVPLTVAEGLVSVVTKDLDGDGDNDLAVAAAVEDEAWLLLNAGDGSFSTELAYASPAMAAVSAGDFDADGVCDLVVSAGDLAVLLNECSIVSSAPEPVDVVVANSDLHISAAPNPFGSVTRFSFDLEREASVDVEVFDVSGRVVRNWRWQDAPAGRHAIDWDGRNDAGQDVSWGVYWVRVSAAGESDQKKVVRVR